MRMLACPDAYYSADKIKILCKVRKGEPCVHVHYCHMKGYWKHTEHAFNCPKRSDKEVNDA